MKKYEYWAWMNIVGQIISPHFSSEAKARKWMRERRLLGNNYSLFAKLIQKEEKTHD